MALTKVAALLVGEATANTEQKTKRNKNAAQNVKKDLAHKRQARALDARSRIIIHVRKCYSLAFSLRVYICRLAGME